MQILMLGGTRFAGYHLAEQALTAGHGVTLLHRGRTNAAALPAAEHLIADRDGGLAVLGERRWDAVVDLCGYVPRVVRASAELLRERVDAYLFVSSISVYAEPFEQGYQESHALAKLDDPATEEYLGPAYGGLKALCEGVVQEVFRDRAIIVRPGLICGPRDYTDRFAYWVRRMAAGGEVLAPGEPAQAVQFVDARDLASFYLELLESHTRGVFHVTGPGTRLDMAGFLAAAKTALGSSANLAWLPERFLLAEGITPWSQMPLWVPAADAGHNEADISRALAAGLRLRPLAETFRDTLAWERSLPPEVRAGSPTLKPEHEAQLIAKWRAQSQRE